MSTRGWSLTLAIGLGTAWLVVYEGPSKGKPLNGVLGPVLLAALAACLVWFLLDAHIKRHYRRVRGVPWPTASIRPHPESCGSVQLILRGLAGVAVAWCEVQDKEGCEWRAAVNLLYTTAPIPTLAQLDFPQEFPSATPAQAGTYRYRWLIESHASRGTMQEVAAGRFKIKQPQEAPLSDPLQHQRQAGEGSEERCGGARS